MKVAKIAVIFLFIAYPFVVYFGLSSFGAKGLALILMALVGVRFLVHRRDKNSSPLLWGLLASFAVITLVSVLTLILDSADPLRYYPVAMNVVMLILFGMTLLRPPSMIEQIARLRHKTLPPRAVGYTRVVTEVWCGFFVLNGLIALYTALFADLAVWTIYNGMISYILMGALFVGEFVVRRHVQRQHQTAPDAP